MGTELARSLVSRGWNVACFDVNEKTGEALVAELGDHSIFVKCDVADYEDQARAYTQTWNKWGRLDALLMNAGIVDRSSLYILPHRNNMDIPPAPDTACTDVDYKGVVYGTQLAIHFMRKNSTPGGAIIATSSIAAIHPHPSFPEYCGAKAAVMNFCRAMAMTLKLNENITVNCVLPGIVRTPIIAQAMVDAVSEECLTPISTIVSAYNLFLDDLSRNGQVVECSVDKHCFVPEPELLNGQATKRAVTVYEPLHTSMHGEESGLKGTFR
ncbi:hypothetical protein F5Y18DRAFT_324747 [Xylariaceae sp. FL1019]|nr:hypothetical protein F5Y18DRAFT_324747 [Xylariaceae sp. FL1019]